MYKTLVEALEGFRNKNRWTKELDMKRRAMFQAAPFLKAGWPDRIVNGIAIEEKRAGDRMRKNQRICHEWLYVATGMYPLIQYTAESGKTIFFENYHIFELYQHKTGGLTRLFLELYKDENTPLIQVTGS